MKPLETPLSLKVLLRRRIVFTLFPLVSLLICWIITSYTVENQKIWKSGGCLIGQAAAWSKSGSWLINQAAAWSKSGSCLIDQAATMVKSCSCLIDQAAARLKSGSCLIDQDPGSWEVYGLQRSWGKVCNSVIVCNNFLTPPFKCPILGFVWQ